VIFRLEALGGRAGCRTEILYPAIERANELLVADGKPPIPDIGSG
jgi:hypothetical protein